MDRNNALLTLVPRRLGRLMILLPLAFLGYFFVYPLVTILITGLSTSQTGISIFDVLARPSLRRIAWFTVWQAAASTLLTVMVALPVAHMMARYEFWGKRVLRAAITVPFILPTVVVGAAFLALLGPEGPLSVDLRRTVWAILAAHVFFNFAIVVRTVATSLESIDPSYADAAVTLGADRIATWRLMTWPLMAPAVISASAIVFLFCFTSFGVVLILGDLVHTTIEVEIWRQATGLLNWPAAAALATVQLVAVSAVLIVYNRAQTKRGYAASGSGMSRRPVGWRQRSAVAFNLLLIAIVAGSPIVAVVAKSLSTRGGIGFANYMALTAKNNALYVTATEAIVNSVVFAIAATAISLAVGMTAASIIAKRKTRLAPQLDVLLMLPLGTSAVTLGFGFLVALDQPIDLRTSIWLIPIAHALVAVPFVVRSTVPVLGGIRPHLREAAAVLGARPLQVYRYVDFPIVRKAVAVGGAFAFAVSMGEFGATSFIARPNSSTVPIAVYRLLTRPSSTAFNQAMALTTVLILITAAAVMVIERWRSSGLEDF